VQQYKVLVVDDSAFMRKIVSDFIAEDGRFVVVDTAKNGREAVDKVKALSPDAVTMDVEMPEMNGLEALEIIMREHPTPVLMLSSLTFAGAAETIRALELGAVDFVAKPSGAISLDLFNVKKEIIDKLTIAVQSKTRNLRLAAVEPKPVKPPLKARDVSAKVARGSPPGTFRDVVAIGTSTGGPKALQYVLSHIPENFPAPLLIVQHMPPKFTRYLAQRLDGSSPVHVVEAEHGQVVEAGTAYIAPGGLHMTLAKGGSGEYTIRLSEEEPRSGHRPSVDVLYESLLAFHELKRHFVLMTGMGSDGAKGMKALREAGAETTIAEAEETCVVFGMPKAAIKLQAVQHILPLYEIPGKLTEILMKDLGGA
jgi:two-component system chemotaxis response regulator CheB